MTRDFSPMRLILDSGGGTKTGTKWGGTDFYVHVGE